MNPTKEFRDYLISQGAALVGIGDLTAVPSSDYPVGIAVAIPLPKHVIKGLQLAPTRAILRTLQFFERQTEHHRNCRCEIPD